MYTVQKWRRKPESISGAGFWSVCHRYNCNSLRGGYSSTDSLLTVYCLSCAAVITGCVKLKQMVFSMCPQFMKLTTKSLAGVQ